MPIVDINPTMVIGLVLNGFKQFSIVASLTKEFDSFYANSAIIKEAINLEKKKQWFI